MPLQSCTEELDSSKLSRENVTARGEVRDDGRRRIARGAIRGLRRQDFAGRYTTKMPDWSVWLWSLAAVSLSRRGCSFVVCGRGASMRETSMGETVEAGTFGQGIFFSPLPLTHNHI
jgi:hypothetical protein